jgi:hypothetical protein
MNITLHTLNIQLHPNGTVQTLDNSNLIRHITTDENNRLYVSKDNIGNTVSCLNQHGNLIPLDPQAVLTAQNNYLQVPVNWREIGGFVQFQENRGVWSNTLPHSLYTRTGLNPQNNGGRLPPPINFNRNAAAQQALLDTLAQNSLNAVNAQNAAQQATYNQQLQAWNQARQTTTTTTIHHGLPVAVGIHRVPVAIGAPTWNGLAVDAYGRGVYTYNGLPVDSDYRIGRAINGWVFYP